MKIKKIFITIIIILLMATGCSGRLQNIKEKNEITKKAKMYLAEKYNAEKFSYKIIKNELHGKNKLCFNVCPSNYMKIKLNNNTYFVEYDLENDIFSDDIQYNIIYNAFLDKFSEMYKKPNDIYANIEKQNTKYYDGTNLESVVKNIHTYAYYYEYENYDSNVANTFLKDFHDSYAGYINLLYFKNLSDYNKFKAEGTTHQESLSFSYNTTYGKYLDFYVSINNRGKITKGVNGTLELGQDLTLNAWDLSSETKLEQISEFDLDSIEDFDKTKYVITSPFYRLISNEDMKTPKIFIKNDMCIKEKCVIVTRRIIKNGDIVYSIFNLSDDNDKYYFKTDFHSNEFEFVILKYNE